MGLDEREYLKEGHYPSCTCVSCCRKRSEEAARQNRCDRHDRAMGPDGCHLCHLEGIDSPMIRPPDSPKASGNGESRGQIGKRISHTLRDMLGKKDSP